MSGNDNDTYGFSKADAEELVEMIGGGETEYPELRPRQKSKGEGEGKLYGFKLTNNGFLTTQTATADIYELANNVFGTMIADEATIYDPSKWAAGAAIDLRGLCIKQGGSYYAIQAACAVETP
jgi:hypothetical protein